MTPTKKPFPWKCHHCFKREVRMSVMDYDAEIKCCGCLRKFTIPNLKIPTCQACGEIVFTCSVDEQINRALKKHVMKPDQHLIHAMLSVRVFQVGGSTRINCHLIDIDKALHYYSREPDLKVEIWLELQELMWQALRNNKWDPLRIRMMRWL